MLIPIAVPRTLRYTSNTKDPLAAPSMYYQWLVGWPLKTLCSVTGPAVLLALDQSNSQQQHCWCCGGSRVTATAAGATAAERREIRGTCTVAAAANSAVLQALEWDAAVCWHVAKHCTFSLNRRLGRFSLWVVMSVGVCFCHRLPGGCPIGCVYLTHTSQKPCSTTAMAVYAIYEAE